MQNEIFDKLKQERSHAEAPDVPTSQMPKLPKGILQTQPAQRAHEQEAFLASQVLLADQVRLAVGSEELHVFIDRCR